MNRCSAVILLVLLLVYFIAPWVGMAGLVITGYHSHLGWPMPIAVCALLFNILLMLIGSRESSQEIVIDGRLAINFWGMFMMLAGDAFVNMFVLTAGCVLAGASILIRVRSTKLL